MYDPSKDPALLEALGPEAGSLLAAAAQRHVAAIFDDNLERLEAAGGLPGTVAALERAMGWWVSLLLGFINDQGWGETFGSQDLRMWRHAAVSWIEDEELARELFDVLLHPDDPRLPRAEVLERSRKRASAPVPPYQYPWDIYGPSFRRAAAQMGFLDPELREKLLALRD